MTIRTKTLTRVVAACFIFFSLFMLWEAYHPARPYGRSWATDAIVYPKGVLFLLLISSALFFFQKPESKEVKIEKIPSLLGIYASFIGYSLTLPVLGFFLSTLLWVAYMAWYVEEKRIWMALLIGFLGTAIAYFLFWVVLRVPFPEGYIINLEKYLG